MAFAFDPNVLHDIVKRVVGQPLEVMIEQIVTELDGKYPGLINTNRDWIFSNAGGAMGQMMVLHASITEYIIIFGSPIGTEGHSGRFYAEDYFFILEGEQWAYEQGDLHRKVFKPGDLHVLSKGRAKGYRMPDRCFALEYCRGAIPLMLPFGVADTVTSTLDFPCLWQTFKVYGQSATKALMAGKL